MTLCLFCGREIEEPKEAYLKVTAWVSPDNVSTVSRAEPGKLWQQEIGAVLWWGTGDYAHAACVEETMALPE